MRLPPRRASARWSARSMTSLPSSSPSTPPPSLVPWRSPSEARSLKL
uniref:Uncharacterized protein n=1 Tax=Arundo donax TaxID=35708 RepID=A0A0A9GCK0_ARUDO